MEAEPPPIRESALAMDPDAGVDTGAQPPDSGLRYAHIRMGIEQSCRLTAGNTYGAYHGHISLPAQPVHSGTVFHQLYMHTTLKSLSEMRNTLRTSCFLSAKGQKQPNSHMD